MTTALPILEPSFYVAGGNLMPDARSYVKRAADDELFESVRDGSYSYVLTSRQMGKSSLMHRTAGRLQEAGITSVLLDLTSIGANLSVDQWYFGLLAEIGLQLGLRAEMERYWTENALHGPLYRFTHALTEVALANITGPIAIFIDEIDFVRGLRFPTDEFFAAIRQCYNARASSEPMRRLTFCLLGVATPADLIRDARTTPFNIGRQIELSDFTEDQALPLADGLDQDRRAGRAKLRRILYWTNGHPYLTQKLCLAATELTGCSIADIDRLCNELFLANRARTSEDNLIFVHNTIRNNMDDISSALRTYRRVRSGKRVDNDPANPVVSLLKLAGIVRPRGGHLVVRNRIYKTVFDLKWVDANMPDAALRRERAAYRRGLWTAVGISTIVVSAIGGLAWGALSAERQAKTAHAQLEIDLRKTRHNLGVQYLELAQQALGEHDLVRTVSLLKQSTTIKDEDFTQRFEWRWLRQQCVGNRLELAGLTHQIKSIAFLSGGLQVEAVDANGIVALWDTANGATIQVRGLAANQPISAAAIAPRGREVALACGTGVVEVFDTATGKIAARRSIGPALAIQYSPSGDAITAGTTTGKAITWYVKSGRVIQFGAPHHRSVSSVCLSPDGRLVAAGISGGDVQLWNVRSGRLLHTFNCGQCLAVEVAISPNGHLLAAAGINGVVRVWDLNDYHLQCGFSQGSQISAIAFRADGRALVTGAIDRAAYTWRVSNGEGIEVFAPNSAMVLSCEFSPSGDLLATGAHDGSVDLWKTTDTQVIAVPLRNPVPSSTSAQFTPDAGTLIERSVTETAAWSTVFGKRLWTTATDFPSQLGTAVCCSRNVVGVAESNRTTLRKIATGRLSRLLLGGQPAAIALSPDGRLMAEIAVSGQVIVSEVASGTTIVQFHNHACQWATAIFSPNGDTLAIARSDGVMDIWDLGRRMLADSVRTSQVFSQPAFSPDGKLLAWLDGNNIAMWSASRLARCPSIPTGDSNAACISFSPGGRAVVVGLADGTIRFWDIAAGQETLSIHAHSGALVAIAFTPDGRTMVTVGGDNYVRRWDADFNNELPDYKD